MENIVDIAVLEEKQKVTNHRLDNLEKKVDELIDFKFTVQALSTTVNDLKNTVDKINSRDGDTYRNLKYAVISSIVLGVVGFILGKLF